MKTYFCSKEKGKRKKEEGRWEESPAGASRAVSPFLFSRPVFFRHTLRRFTFFLFTFSLFLWPVAGHGQSSFRRDRDSDRFRRSVTPAPGATRPGSGGPQTSAPSSAARAEFMRRDGAPAGTTAPAGSSQETTGRITGPAEPNVPARPIERSQPRRVVQDERWTPYEIINQRNMFSRYRVPIRQREEPRPEPVRIMPNPESYLLLKGIVQEDHEHIAFVEDKRTGSVLRLRAGDTVARGLVKSLTLDNLEYEFEDKAMMIHVGSDLEGGSGAITAGDLSSFTPMAPSSGPGAPPPTADEAEIIKRLMEQRRQQMGQ